MEKLIPNAVTMLTKFFNSCFSAGYLPSAFKKGIIKFIPKENKPIKQNLNYKPITLRGVPDKLFEEIIQGRLSAFLIDNNIVKDRQHGFSEIKVQPQQQPQLMKQ